MTALLDSLIAQQARCRAGSDGGWCAAKRRCKRCQRGLALGDAKKPAETPDSAA
jgi:hypothetical protein